MIPIWLLKRSLRTVALLSAPPVGRLLKNGSSTLPETFGLYAGLKPCPAADASNPLLRALLKSCRKPALIHVGSDLVDLAQQFHRVIADIGAFEDQIPSTRAERRHSTAGHRAYADSGSISPWTSLPPVLIKFCWVVMGIWNAGAVRLGGAAVKRRRY